MIQNDVLKVQISKKSITGADEIQGATLHLYGKDVDLTWISGDSPYCIEGLPEGTYKLEEISAPNGYYYHEEISFVVSNSGEIQMVEMKDAPIEYEIHKVDEEGNPVEGVKLQLFDLTDQKEIPLENDGITTKQPFKLSQVLSIEHQYELREIKGKEGYYTAASILFEVPKYNTDVIHISLTDIRTGVYVNKVDQYGEAVSGAELEILKARKQEDGSIIPLEEQVIHTFTTKATYEDISAYVEGSNEENEQWYILREKQTPFGYEKIQDIPFCVTGTKKMTQVIQATDIRKEVTVKIVKVDASNSKHVLQDAEFVLRDREGNVLKDVYGNPCNGKTKEDGTLFFTIPYVDVCYLSELRAPAGYSVMEETVEIRPSCEKDFVEPITLWIENTPEKIVNTTDRSNVFANCSVFVVSLIIGAWMLKERIMH